MLQVARNLSDVDDGFLRGKKYLLMDRDTKFSDTGVGANTVGADALAFSTTTTPPEAPYLLTFDRSGCILSLI
jgi:hypothetical protein